jgi:hypothetical protein
VVVNNLRNPNSTRYFSFKAVLTDSSGLPYYSLTSSNYQAALPYPLTPTATLSNCIVLQASTLAVTFPFLPFLPSSAVILDDPAASLVRGEQILNTFGYPIPFSPFFSTALTNSYSLQPVYYQLLVKTSDYLYDIFSFTIVLQACNPAALPILSFQFTGLPEDPGTLSLSINQLQVTPAQGGTLNPIRFITLQFPSEFSPSTSVLSNAASTVQVSPRVFNLTVGSVQPIAMEVWNFTSTISGYFQVQTYAQSQSGSGLTYQVSSSSNVVRYNLSLLTSCAFPCKICSASNLSVCLQCYSAAITQQYFLDSSLSTCLSPSNCSPSTYPNATALQCQPCPGQCATCVSPSNCTSCAGSYYLLNGSCLTDCPSGYYPISVQQVCGDCQSSNNGHCASCLSLKKCSSCQYPYLL